MGKKNKEENEKIFSWTDINALSHRLAKKSIDLIYFREEEEEEKNIRNLQEDYSFLNKEKEWFELEARKRERKIKKIEETINTNSYSKQELISYAKDNEKEFHKMRINFAFFSSWVIKILLFLTIYKITKNLSKFLWKKKKKEENQVMDALQEKIKGAILGEFNKTLSKKSEELVKTIKETEDE